MHASGIIPSCHAYRDASDSHEQRVRRRALRKGLRCGQQVEPCNPELRTEWNRHTHQGNHDPMSDQTLQENARCYSNVSCTVPRIAQPPAHPRPRPKSCITDMQGTARTCWDEQSHPHLCSCLRSCAANWPGHCHDGVLQLAHNSHHSWVLASLQRDDLP